MYTYEITGEVFDDNNELVEISETVEVEDRDTGAAYTKFFKDNEYWFFGSLKTCDVATGGELGATYKDGEGHSVDIDLKSIN